jgi:hypothetical protein
VSPPGFTGTIVGEIADVTIARRDPTTLPERARLRRSELDVAAHLRRPQPGLSVAQANARLAVVWPPLVTAAVPASMPGAPAKSESIQLRSGATGATNERGFQQPLAVLMTVVGLVLRSGVRTWPTCRSRGRRAPALKLPFGWRSAPAGSIVRQLRPSALLSRAVRWARLRVVGGQFLVDLLSSGRLTPSCRLTRRARLAFTSLVAMSTTLLFGVAPAFRATTVDPAAAMNAARVASRRRRAGSVRCW